MRLVRILKASFTLHEIAVMGIVITFALGVLALTAIFTGRIGFGIILFLSTAVVEIFFYALSLCSERGESPFVRYRIDLGRVELPIWCGWPRRECSKCGASLTSPEQT